MSHQLSVLILSNPANPELGWSYLTEMIAKTAGYLMIWEGIAEHRFFNHWIIHEIC
jgi:hypothetical protein